MKYIQTKCKQNVSGSRLFVLITKEGWGLA